MAAPNLCYGASIESHRGAARSARLLLFLPEDGADGGLGCLAPLADFQLAEDGVPADIDSVPLGFQGAQGAFIHFPQIPQRRGVTNQNVDFLPSWGGNFDGSQDQFQFLREDALCLQELVIILLAEFRSEERRVGKEGR